MQSMTYISEGWALKNKKEIKIQVAVMRTLKWMCGLTKSNRIRSKYIRRNLEALDIDGKMKENKLRLFGKKRHNDKVIRKINDTIIKRNQGSSSQNEKQMEIIMRVGGVKRTDTGASPSCMT